MNIYKTTQVKDESLKSVRNASVGQCQRDSKQPRKLDFTSGDSESTFTGKKNSEKCGGLTLRTFLKGGRSF